MSVTDFIESIREDDRDVADALDYIHHVGIERADVNDVPLDQHEAVILMAGINYGIREAIEIVESNDD